MYQISISIIITCHNLHQYLEECVESVKAQTMRVSEVIILHDNCVPAPVYKGTTTIFRDTHKGVAQTRNEGARLATSDHLLFVDADDCLDEHFIEAMVNTKANSKAEIIYPNVLLWSHWHKEVKIRNAWHESPDKITLKNMLKYNQIVVSSLIPKDIYFKAGGMPDIPILEDYQLWLECLSKNATFAKSPFSVLRYRQRQEGRNRRNDELKNEWFYRIKEKYED